ncbi:DUF6838 family protein [Paenibacillus sp. RC67]|uniref:phage tail terminator family protein n=1 Tax=Paenibacillus sp. RC67 TaxID=3039392 RepID=UPI0024AD9460|nr:hypothetical protein [Paenibacillus sp. RC67]
MIFEEMKNALLVQLKSLGFDIPIYDENNKQDLQKPSFLMLLVSSKQVKEINGRYRYPTLFSIQYFPNPGNRTIPIGFHEMAERLYEELEYMEWEGKRYRGYELHHEILEDSLQFYISFDIHVTKQKPSALKMKHLEQEERYK